MSDTSAGKRGAATASMSDGDASACAAHDLKHVIAALISQISAADRRQTDALDAMQVRLEELGSDARSMQRRVPVEFADAFGRLEDALSGLAKRLGEVQRADVPPPAQVKTSNAAAMDRVQASLMSTMATKPAGKPVSAPVTSAEPAPATRGKEIAEPPPALRSAIFGEAAGSRIRRIGNDGRGKTSVDPFDFVGESVDGDPEEPWNDADAEALTRAYENVTGNGAPLTPVFTKPGQASTSSPVTAVSASVAAPVAGLAAADRAWLEGRFADIAARIDTELKRLDPEAGFSDFSRRFDQMEKRFGQALEDVATRSDVEGIRIVEACLNDLSEQFERTQTEVARFGSLEAEVVALAGRLSEEKLAALSAPVVAPAPEIDVAGLAQSIAAYIEANRKEPEAARPVVVDDQRFVSGVDELKEVVERLVEAQRSGDDQTNSMLDTMQQALIRLLDRMETIEAAQQSLAEQRVAVDAAPEFVPERRNAVEPELPMARPMAAAGGDHAANHHRSAPASPVGKPSAPNSAPEARHTQQMERTPAQAQAAAAMARQAPAVAEPPPAAAPRDRQQFIEAARRAAQAASERHVPPPHPMQAAMPPQAAQQGRPNDPVAAMRRQMAATAETRSPIVEDEAEPARRGFPWIGTKAAAGEAAPDAAAPAGRQARQLPGLGGGKAVGNAGRTRLLAAVLVAVVIGFGGFKLLNGRTKVQTAEPQKVERQLVTPETLEREKAGASEREEPAAREPTTTQAAPDRSGQVEEPDTGAQTPRRTNGDGVNLMVPSPTVAAADNTGQGGDVETPFSLGIEVDRGGPRPTPAELDRNRLQQHYARWSTQVGATQPPLVGMPAALSPERPLASRAVVTDDQGARHTPQTTALPPTSVGPLSLRMAAANGDASAEFAVGARLAEGKAGAQDFKQAMIWYQRAASRGFALAQYRLATLYERGLGAKADQGRARIWYLRAAEQGNVKAMHNLAVLAAGQNGAQPDYATAATWFGEAAERGLADSQFNLAILYESGLGVSADSATAYKWFALAARNGDGEAGKRLTGLSAKMTSAEKKRAEAEVSSWRARPVIALANDPFVAGEAWKQGQQGQRTAAPRS